MANFTSSSPNMRKIGVSQDEERNLRRQLAKAHYYTVANRWHFAGSVFASILALASPVVLFLWPSQGPLLGAIAGAWIFLSRLLFEPVKQSYQQKGAAAQEMFDCDVFGLPWNSALVRQPSEEEIRKSSKLIGQAKHIEKHKAWYPTDVKAAWPKSVLICQRSNAVWARRQHSAYGILLVVLAGLWMAFGVVLSLVHGASLAEYLTTIALPSLPAVLDATELSKKHFQASAKRQTLEDSSNELFDQGNATHDSLREIQDQIFSLRRDAPPVAGWFYKMVSKSYEQDMRYAAQERAGWREAK